MTLRCKTTNFVYLKKYLIFGSALVSSLVLGAAVNAGECYGYAGPGGACYAGPGGGLYPGPGGGLYPGPGGGLYAGPGGGLYPGPGGGMYPGPGGGLYPGPGGGLYPGPGGGVYVGPPGGSQGDYRGPWGPCITGAATDSWLSQNCPNRR
jgi:hypothetical protein